MTMTFYHYWRSSCSWRVRWALALKKVPHQSVHINLLRGEHTTKDYLQLNPSGYVPCLVINDKPYGESLAMLEWLEEAYPQNPLLPNDPLGRMTVRQLSLIVVAGTQPMQNLEAQKFFSDDADERAAYARHWIARGMDSLEKMVALNGGKYAFGDSLTIADLCLVPQAYNAMRFGMLLSGYPATEQVYNRCRELTECNSSAPEKQPEATP